MVCTQGISHAPRDLERLAPNHRMPHSSPLARGDQRVQGACRMDSPGSRLAMRVQRRRRSEAAQIGQNHTADGQKGRGGRRKGKRGQASD
jgi:hypothetical protein